VDRQTKTFFMDYIVHGFCCDPIVPALILELTIVYI